MFDRDIFFDQVRTSPFNGGLSQEQVDGMNVILAVWEFTKAEDLRKLAYMLATVFHECATRMWPVTEYGSQEYLQSKDYWPYIGRGLVQLTWESNYSHAGDELGRDLVGDPELALDSLIATRVMFRGMADGWFTGKNLGDYFNDSRDDPVNARQIINGNDDDELIAGYHRDFLAALTASWQDKPAPEPELPTGAIVVGTTVAAGTEVQFVLNGEIVWTGMQT